MSAIITTRHYLKRALTSPIELALMLVLPMAIIALQLAIMADIETIMGFPLMYQGYNLLNTNVVMMVMLMFVFMSGGYAGEYLFLDLRSANRWRLNAAPVASAAYVFGTIATGTILGCISATLILVVGHIFFNVYVGSLIVIIPVVVLSALMSQFIGIIVALFAKSRGAINGITVGISFLMSAMLGAFFVNIPAPEFVRNWILPMGVAARAIRADTLTPAGFREIDYSMTDSFVSLGIMVGMTVLFAAVTLILARRRPA